MSVTNQKQYIQEEQQRVNNQKAVSQANAKNYNDSPVSAEKRKSWQVTTPAATYTMGQDPGQYKSRYQPALDSILAQLANPDEFKYEFNGDELFKQYADMYTQKGKQASLDAMGQLAGLTGGYGNSYAQQAGNQAYQQYLLGLYDRGDQLRQQAFNEWQAGRADDYNRMNAIMNADQMDYGRYRDDVADWRDDRDYYTQAEDRAYNRDYNEWAQDRDYWTQQGQMENADWWNAMNFNEQMRNNDANRRQAYDFQNTENQYRYDTLNENFRQFNENLAESIRQFQETSRLDWAKLEEQHDQYYAGLTEEQRQYDRDNAINYVNAILAAGQMPSPELLIAAGISQEDAQKLMAQLVEGDGGGGGGGGSSGGRRSGSGTEPPAENNQGSGGWSLPKATPAYQIGKAVTGTLSKENIAKAGQAVSNVINNVVNTVKANGGAEKTIEKAVNNTVNNLINGIKNAQKNTKKGVSGNG